MMLSLEINYHKNKAKQIKFKIIKIQVTSFFNLKRFFQINKVNYNN